MAKQGTARSQSESPETMHGVWLTGHGDTDKLEIRSDIPVPRPGPRDVLIRVAAALGGDPGGRREFDGVVGLTGFGKFDELHQNLLAGVWSRLFGLVLGKR